MVTALIIGSAPCVKSDLAAAKLLRPHADMIAVKFSVALVHARVAVTHHGEHAERMKRLHRERWGDDVEIHMPKKMIAPEFKPFVDKFWIELSGVGGTSAWGAARMAKLMGYDEAILCGCPLNVVDHGERYHDETVAEAARAVGVKPYRGEPFANTAAVRGYRNYIMSDRDRGLASGIVSMSGWTQKTLGAPHG